MPPEPLWVAGASDFAVNGEWRRRGLFVVGVRADGISSITRFHDSPRLDAFGVPAFAPRLAGGIE